jgi:hypothetical protein
MWKALRRKFLAHSGKWTTIPWTVLSVDTHNLSFITVEPQQLYHIQGCAMMAGRGVLDSRERKSLHFGDNSNGVNAEHCWCGDLLHNGLASNFCISVTCSYSCRPIPRFVPFSNGASSSLSLP